MTLSLLQVSRFGRASLAARRICAASRSRGRDSPIRFILPITELRVTPISRAIWLQVSPASKQRLSCSTRSELQVKEVVDIAGLIARREAAAGRDRSGSRAIRDRLAARLF